MDEDIIKQMALVMFPKDKEKREAFIEGAKAQAVLHEQDLHRCWNDSRQVFAYQERITNIKPPYISFDEWLQLQKKKKGGEKCLKRKSI